MRLQTIIIGMLVFGALMTGFYTFLGDLTGPEGYDIDISNDTAYQAAYNKTTDLSQQLNDSYSDLQDVSPDRGLSYFTGAWDMFKIAKDIITTPFSLLLGSDGMINTLAGSEEDKGLGLAPWIQGLVFGLIIVLIIFAVMAIVIKWKG